MSMQTCPACKKSPVSVYRCNMCGDIRCGSSCIGTNGGPRLNASRGGNCHACGKGKYQGPL